MASQPSAPMRPRHSLNCAINAGCTERRRKPQAAAAALTAPIRAASTAAHRRPAPAGAGLITIERERVFASQWFKSTTTSSVQRIKLPDDFEGNGYVSVQFVRDPSSDELFISPLSYGVAPFGANLPMKNAPHSNHKVIARGVK